MSHFSVMCALETIRRMANLPVISGITNGNGRELAKTLYGRSGAHQLRKFARILRSLTPDSLSTNPSRSGQTIARRFGETMSRLAPVIGLAVGDMTGLVAGITLSTGGKAVARRKAIQAINKPVPPAKIFTKATVAELLTRGAAEGAVTKLVPRKVGPKVF